MEKTEVIQPYTKARLVIHILMLIGMWVAIGVLITTTITIYKYKDLLANPLGYSMEKFGLNYCTCYDSKHRIVPIKGLSYDDSFDQFIPKTEYAKQDYSYVNNFTVNK